MYAEDELWLDAKRMAKENDLSGNWLEMIDFYNSQGGKNVQIYVALNHENRRILHVTEDLQALLLNRDGTLTVEDYNEVMEGPKTFFYKEPTNEIVHKIPKKVKYYDIKEIIVYE